MQKNPEAFNQLICHYSCLHFAVQFCFIKLYQLLALEKGILVS